MSVQLSVPDKGESYMGTNKFTEFVLRVLEGNRELASKVYHQEPGYEATIQTELVDRFGWNANRDAIRDAIDELGPDSVKSCARPNPY